MDDLALLIHRETQRAVEHQCAVLETQIMNVVLMYGFGDLPLHVAAKKLAEDGWCILNHMHQIKMTGRRHFVQLRKGCRLGEKVEILAMALPRLRITADSIEI